MFMSVSQCVSRAFGSCCIWKSHVMNAVASGVKDLTKQWLVILTGHVWTGMRWAKELTREVGPDSATAHRVRIMSNSKYKLDISCPSSIGNETYNFLAYTDRKPFAARIFEFDNKTLTIYTNFNYQAMPILQFNLKMFRTLCEDVTVIFDNWLSLCQEIWF